MNKGKSFLVVLSTVFGGFVSYVNAAGAEQTWFDAGIAGYAQEQSPWPDDGSNKIVENEGTWSGTTNATYDTEHSALVVNAGTNTLDFAAATTAEQTADAGPARGLLSDLSRAQAISPMSAAPSTA